MDWLAVDIEFERGISEEQLDWVADLLSSVFEQHGVNGIEIKPKLGIVIGYLPADTKAEERVRNVKDALERLIEVNTEFPWPKSVRVKRFSEKEWTQTLFGTIKPRRVGDRLIVTPSWEKPDPKPDDLVLIIDRCQAFGTGDHQTTQLCLELIEKYVKQGDVVADIGTGSGILSIAALKLGALQALAIDNDPLSIEAATANMEINGVLDRARLAEASGFDLPEENFTLVVSNINTFIIIQLIPDAVRAIPKGVLWIMSGITISNWLNLKEKLEEAGFEILEKRESGDWVAAIVRR
jgi:ribosomal protein L11 methyltransferase